MGEAPRRLPIETSVPRADPRLPPDVRQLAQTVDLLGVPEIEIFVHAHQWWSGEPAPEALLDRTFGEYLRDQVTPLWVRHYCRSVVEAAGEGRLDPAEFGVAAPTLDRPSRRERAIVALIVVAALLVYLLFFN